MPRSKPGSVLKDLGRRLKAQLEQALAAAGALVPLPQPMPQPMPVPVRVRPRRPLPRD